MRELAIVALTPRGLDLGRRLAQVLGQGEVMSAQGTARLVLEETFRTGTPLVCVMALGIVVRILGPLAGDKETDPPVVVVDEAGRFAISVLGGHAAGANDLAQRVAAALAATPVITTASDVLGLPAIDLIGRDCGWRIEPESRLTTVAAALVRGEMIGVYQDAGRPGDWPASFQIIRSWPPQGRWPALLVISDRVLSGVDRWPSVIYRPPSLVLGVGCRRGVPCAEIEALFQDVCRSRGLAVLSLGVVATASLKAGEAGLLEFAAQHQVPVRFFGLEELAGVTTLPTPSEKVRAKIGIAGVAEPAAMLAAGNTALVVPKQRGKRTTMAMARIVL